MHGQRQGDLKKACNSGGGGGDHLQSGQRKLAVEQGGSLVERYPLACVGVVEAEPEGVGAWWGVGGDCQLHALYDLFAGNPGLCWVAAAKRRGILLRHHAALGVMNMQKAGVAGRRCPLGSVDQGQGQGAARCDECRSGFDRIALEFAPIGELYCDGLAGLDGRAVQNFDWRQAELGAEKAAGVVGDRQALAIAVKTVESG